MKWYNHELDDEPNPEPYDECPDGWDKHILLLMLSLQRRGKPTVETRDLHPVAGWLTGYDEARQVTPSQRPKRPNKDFSPVIMPSSGVNREPF